MARSNSGTMLEHLRHCTGVCMHKLDCQEIKHSKNESNNFGLVNSYVKKKDCCLAADSSLSLNCSFPTSTQKHHTGILSTLASVLPFNYKSTFSKRK